MGESPASGTMQIELMRKLMELSEDLGQITGEFKQMQKKLDDRDKKLDDLNSFRWRLYGAAAGIGFITGLISSIIAIMRFR